MTSPLMRLVARSVASSALAEDCTVVLASGVEFPTRATWLHREVEREVSGDRGYEVVLESSIRVPADDLVGDDGKLVLPISKDRVRIDGVLWGVLRAFERGPVVEISLTSRGVR